jgi:hypothetical protein
MEEAIKQLEAGETETFNSWEELIAGIDAEIAEHHTIDATASGELFEAQKEDVSASENQFYDFPFRNLLTREEMMQRARKLCKGLGGPDGWDCRMDELTRVVVDGKIKFKCYCCIKTVEETNLMTPKMLSPEGDSYLVMPLRVEGICQECMENFPTKCLTWELRIMECDICGEHATVAALKNWLGKLCLGDNGKGCLNKCLRIRDATGVSWSARNWAEIEKNVKLAPGSWYVSTVNKDTTEYRRIDHLIPGHAEMMKAWFGEKHAKLDVARVRDAYLAQINQWNSNGQNANELVKAAQELAAFEEEHK